VRRLRITRFEREGFHEIEELVAEEGLVSVEIPPDQGFSAVVTPDKIREFVYGHLLGAGLIRDREDVVESRERADPTVGLPGEVFRVEVKVREPPTGSMTRDLIWTACGAGPPPATGLPTLEPHPVVSPETLLALPGLVAGQVEGFRLTGAYHYAFLFDLTPRVRAVAGDIGRHNAVDKALGEELLANGEFGERILFTTGRVSADIALKALRAGIPLVASHGAALLGAITLARRHNLGLVGFLRGKRFNVYSGEGWIRSGPLAPRTP
jgi:FdhD protein